MADIDRSIDFYRRFAEMEVVHRRTSDDGGEVAWITDHTRPFVIVLLQHAPPTCWADGHTWASGWAPGTRSIARLAAAVAEGLDTLGPLDHGPPTGYWGIVVDPDGHNLELSLRPSAPADLAHPPRNS